MTTGFLKCLVDGENYMKKTIVWITPDWFYDVDWPIVNELVKYYDVKWFVIWNVFSKRDIPDNPNIYQFIRLSYRVKDIRNLFTYYRLLKYVQKLNPRVVYNGFDGVPFFYPMAYHMLDPKIFIMEGHEVNPVRRVPNGWLATTCFNYIIRKIGHVHVFSRFVGKELDSLYPGVQYTYIPMIPKDYGLPKEKLSYDQRKIFLFFGNIRKNKRLDILLKAFSELDSNYQNRAQLLVYGSCELSMEDEFRQIVDKCKNVELHFGFASDDLIPDLFTSASFLVLPYESISQSGPNMIAYNYGLPIIATDIDGFTERIEHDKNGFIFPKNNVDSLKKLLMKCIDLTDSDYKTLKLNLSNYVKKEFALDVVIKKYISMIDSVITTNQN